MPDGYPLHGCNNKPRATSDGFMVGAACYGSQKWKFKNSTECQQAINGASKKDPGCRGCRHGENQGKEGA